MMTRRFAGLRASQFLKLLAELYCVSQGFRETSLVLPGSSKMIDWTLEANELEARNSYSGPKRPKPNPAS